MPILSDKRVYLKPLLAATHVRLRHMSHIEVQVFDPF
jgi:hypothetical protein